MKERKLFLRSGILSEVVLDYRQKKRYVCQITFYFSMGTFWGTKLNWFLFCFGFWPEDFSIFVFIREVSLSKLHFTCHVEKKNFQTVSFCFRIFSERMFWFSAKISGRFVKTAFYHSDWKFWGKLSKSFRFFLGILLETFLTGDLIGANLPELYSTCPAESFEEKTFLYENFSFAHFPTLVGKYSDFWQKILHRGLWNGILRVEKKFLVKNYFWTQVKFLWQRFFWKTWQLFSRNWASFAEVFDKKVQTKLSKQRFTCPKEVFGSLFLGLSFQFLFYILLKYLFSFSYVLTLNKNFMNFSTKRFQQGCQNCFLYVQRYILRQNFFCIFFWTFFRSWIFNELFWFRQKKKDSFVNKLHSISLFWDEMKVLQVFLGFCAEKFFQFLAKNWGKSVGTTLYLSRGKFWGKNRSKEVLLPFIGFSAWNFWKFCKKNSQGCQKNIFSCPEGIFLGKNLQVKNFLKFNFGVW